MSHKLLPRLGSAIASTILSVFWAVSLVGVNKAQAAVLTYNFDLDGRGSGFFKVDDSSVTGIGYEFIAVSEGRLDNFAYSFADYFEGSKDYYNLAGFEVSFEQGNFRGLFGSGQDGGMTDYISPPDEPGGPFYLRVEGASSWYMGGTYFGGYWEIVHRYFNYQSYINDGLLITDGYQIYQRSYAFDVPISFTLVNTEPVPEPLTAGGTALALAGLSWLKHKKKMAA